MKTRSLICAGLLLAVTSFAAGTALSQDGESDPMADAMKWMATGPEHKKLERFIGDFDTEWKIWMGGAGSGGPPMVTKGTSTTVWQLPGRFTRTEYSHAMGPMTVEGFSIMGYSRYRKEYLVSSGSNFGGDMIHARGVFDEGGKVITVNGTMDEPSMDVKDKKVKTLIRLVDEDTYVWEIHDLHISGDNKKVVEVTFTRRK